MKWLHIPKNNFKKTKQNEKVAYIDPTPALWRICNHPTNRNESHVAWLFSCTSGGGNQIKISCSAISHSTSQGFHGKVHCTPNMKKELFKLDQVLMRNLIISTVIRHELTYESEHSSILAIGRIQYASRGRGTCNAMVSAGRSSVLDVILAWA